MVPTRRRNFLPTFIVNLFLWLGLLLIILKLSPEQTYKFQILPGGRQVLNFEFQIYSNIVLFFLVLTLALTMTIALILGNTRRGFLLTLFIDGFLLLRLFKLTNWLTLVFLFLILLVFEIYFSRRKTNL